VEVTTQSRNVESSDDETLSDCNDFVAYLRGNTSGWPPVVLSAPHGGYMKPQTIPNRDAGCWIEDKHECEYSHTCGKKDALR